MDDLNLHTLLSYYYTYYCWVGLEPPFLHIQFVLLPLPLFYHQCSVTNVVRSLATPSFGTGPVIPVISLGPARSMLCYIQMGNLTNTLLSFIESSTRLPLYLRSRTLSTTIVACINTFHFDPL